MNRAALLSLVSLATLALVSVAGPAAGDGPALKPLGVASDALTPKPASPPLSPAKKLEALTRALKAAGIAAVAAAPPPAQMVVTPVAPVHPGGAKIAAAGPLQFVSPAPAFADGAYMFSNSPQLKYSLRLDVPSEVGKTVVVDCRVLSLFGNAPLAITVKRGDATATLGDDDGHIVYAFKADKAMQQLLLTGNNTIAFYGCEITRL